MRPLLAIAASILFLGCSFATGSYPQDYQPPEILVTQSARFETPNPGALILLTCDDGRSIVDVASDRGRYAYLDPNFNIVRYSNELPDGRAAFHIGTPYLVPLKTVLPPFDRMGFSIRLNGKSETRKVTYATGGSNLFPGERHAEMREVFTGEVEVRFKGLPILRQKVTNEPVDDHLTIEVNERAGIFAFFHSKDAVHHVDAVYLIKLPELIQPDPAPAT